MCKSVSWWQPLPYLYICIFPTSPMNHIFIPAYMLFIEYLHTGVGIKQGKKGRKQTASIEVTRGLAFASNRRTMIGWIFY